MGKKKTKVNPEILQLRDSAITPKNEMQNHWKTWLISLKSNNIYGNSFTFEEWLDRFKEKDIMTLRNGFLKYYNMQFNESNN